MNIKSIVFSSYICFLFYYPLQALLQIDPMNGIIVKNDGTPADIQSIQNILGPTSGYEVHTKTLKVIRTDGQPVDPEAVQNLIDRNINGVIEQSVGELGHYYDSATGKVYDSIGGTQIVSPDLDQVDQHITESLHTILTHKVEDSKSNKKAEILTKAITISAASVIGIFLIHQIRKNKFRELYSENGREFLKLETKAVLAKVKNTFNKTAKNQEKLQNISEKLEVYKTQQEKTEVHRKAIDALESENTKLYIKEKISTLKAKVANALGAEETANKAHVVAKEAQEKQEKNTALIKDHKKLTTEQSQYSVKRLENDKPHMIGHLE